MTILLLLAVPSVASASTGIARITEILWMGSDSAAEDEWVEVGCRAEREEGSGMGNGDCDVSGWTLLSMNSAGTDVVIARFATGTVIPAGQAIVVSRWDVARSRLLHPPLIVNPSLSLPNTKLRLTLRDATGTMVDIADDGAGAPLAGANPSGGIGRASMQRVRFDLSGSESAAWQTATEVSGFDDGAAVLGSPGTVEENDENDEKDENENDDDASTMCAAFAPNISVQSGSPTGAGKVTINLQATGVPTGGSCTWDYGDGFTSVSCNPPSHTFASLGHFSVRLTVVDRCGTVVERSLPIDVTAVGTGDAPGACIPSLFDGLVISEALPRPPEGKDEWIELWNRSGMERNLCGWMLDDREGGSAPFSLDAVRIGDNERMVLWRSQTHISLNDDADAVRLIAPTGVVVAVPYVHPPRERSLAVRDDDVWLWTPHPTPAQPNRFRAIRDAPRSLRIAAVVPNPHGDDADTEWFAIRNVAGRPLFLHGITLVSGARRATFPDNSALHAGEEKMFSAAELGITLSNSHGAIELRDADDVLLDVLSWKHAPEGAVMRPTAESGAILAHALTVRSDARIDIGIAGPRADHWFSRIDTVSLAGVHILDIDAARAVIEALLHDDAVTIIPSEDGTAFVRTGDDIDLSDALVRRGIAEPSNENDAWRMALVADARADRVGAWREIAEDVAAPIPGVVEYDDPVLLADATVSDESSSVTVDDAQAPAFISEVVSAPMSGEQEWIEIGCDAQEQCILSGWSIDDIADGGSKPYRIPDGTVVQDGELLLLAKNQTKLALNDTGDDVRLLRPDGSLVDAVTFGKIPKGTAYARCDGAWFVTTTPTSGASNICTVPQVTTKKTAAKSTTKKTSAKAPKPDTVGQAQVRALLESAVSGSTMEMIGVDEASGLGDVMPILLSFLGGIGVAASVWWGVRKK